MNNPTIIAVTNTYNDTVTMLPPAATLEGIGNVVFNNDPRLEFTGSELIKNFDYHFDFNIKKNRLHSRLLGDRYFHHPRSTRMTQYINITNFNNERPVEERLFIPDYYLATERHHEHVYMTNFGLPKGDRVVIKEAFGARGGNQMVVPTNMVTTLLKHSKGLTMSEIKTKFPDFIYSDGTDWDRVMFTTPSDIFISELVTGVKVEWRLLVGGNNIYGRERAIKQGPYPQANLDHDVFVAVPEVKYEPIENMFDATLAKTLHELVDHLDLPLGSVDLFLTEDGRYGIFEYSTQFAFMGADNQFIRQLLLDGIHSGIMKHAPIEPNTNPIEKKSYQPIPHVNLNKSVYRHPTPRDSVSNTIYMEEFERHVSYIIEIWASIIDRINKENKATDPDAIDRPLPTKAKVVRGVYDDNECRLVIYVPEYTLRVHTSLKLNPILHLPVSDIDFTKFDEFNKLNRALGIFNTLVNENYAPETYIFEIK